MTASPKVMAVDATRADDWDRFVVGQPQASIYHRYLWREVMAGALGCETHYLAAEEAGSLVGVLPLARLRSLVFGDFLVSLPYFNYGGALSTSAVTDRALMDAAIELAQRLGVSHLELRENAPRAGSWPVRTDKVAMRLALAADPDSQFKALGAKLRSQIRRPEREGAVAVTGGVELLDDFYRVFARNMRDLGTPVYGIGFFRAMLQALGEAAGLVVVRVAGRPAAAGFLVHHAGQTEIPWASSVRDFNPIGVNMLLYWQVLQEAIARGSAEFDFGRSTQDAGTYRFKAQWGAKPTPLYWHYWLAPGRAMPGLNPDNPKFALAIRAWQRLPLWVANRLGPSLVRRLP